MKIEIKELVKLSNRLLEQYGYNKDEAIKITETFLWAEKRNNSQGFTKLFGWRIKEASQLKATIEKSDQYGIIINANKNSQILAANIAIDNLIQKSKSSPFLVAGIKNAVNSSGPIGFHTERLAKAGLIGIMMSAADPGIAPFGGTEAIYGTNPLSISIPCTPAPLLLDMSMANLTWGDLLNYDINQKPLPENSAFDLNGNYTTNASEAMDGAVMTFDKSYKISGLALMIQIIAGPLVGSIYDTNHLNCQYGSLIIAINPEYFGNKELFIDQVETMIKQIKNSKRIDAKNEILMPGERGYKKASKISDYIEISNDLYKRILEAIN